MTPTETALVLLLFTSGGFGLGLGAAPLIHQKIVERKVAVLKDGGHLSLKETRVAACPDPMDRNCSASDPLDVGRSTTKYFHVRRADPACGQHARFDPVELENHKARLAAGVFSRIEPDGEKR